MNMRTIPCLCALPLLLAATPLWAQTAPAEVPVPATAADPAKAVADTPATRVGDATRHLLQRQRAGAEASATTLSIRGDVAEFSHQRYLRSFQQPLPQWFDSRLSNREE